MDPNKTNDDNLNLIGAESNYYTTDEFNSKFNNLQNQLSLLHLNSRSLNKNFDALQNLLQTINNFPFSVIGVTETWLYSNSPPLFNIPNYKMIRADRQGQTGGGVALYILERFDLKIRNDITIEESEVLFIEISLCTKNIIVGVIYRPPNNNIEIFSESLERNLNKLTNENKHIFLLGDFNINMLPNSQIDKGDIFNNLLSSFSFNPHINKPTRINRISHTLIDNIFSNVLDKDVTGGLLYYEISDHLPICITFTHETLPNKLSKNTTCRIENQQNVETLINNLREENWTDVYNQLHSNDAYENFIKKLSFYFDKSIPLTKLKSNKNSPRKPWITRGILRSINQRNCLYKTYLTDPTINNSNKYKCYRNKLTHTIRTSKKLFYSQKLEKTKSSISSTWKILNEVMGKKKTNLQRNEKIIENNTEITNPQDIANSFNSYFVNLGPELASKIESNDTHFKQFLPAPLQNSFFFNPTNAYEIIKVTLSLNSSKSYSHDEISTSLLKQIISTIALPLSYIFNLSFSSGIFPNSLKIAKVIPVHKKDDPLKVSNYRPISILPSISKVIERLVYNRLYTFLTLHNLLNPNQYGFRKNHSTDLALIHLYDKITNSMTCKEHIVSIFMDLRRAFDALDHNILLHKLKIYGVRGIALSWFKDYLTNRHQYVAFNSHNSNSLPIQCGVPQGSILGPLLFLLYVNDISNTSPLLSFILFADDTNIFYSHPDMNTVIHTLNVELPKVSLWFKCNKLSLNLQKTNYIHFKNRNLQNIIPFDIIIDELPLDKKTHTKFLGVTIDEHLTWNEHIRAITTSISRGVGILYKLKHILDIKTLFMQYNAIITPYISYSNAAGQIVAKRK